MDRLDIRSEQDVIQSSESKGGSVMGSLRGIRARALAAAMFMFSPAGSISTSTSAAAAGVVAAVSAPEQALADTYKDHCHRIKNFSGTLDGGKLVKHSYNVPRGGKAPYATQHDGMLGICFYFVGDAEHPPHWQYNLVGPASIYAEGRHDISSADVNECPAVNPCE